MSEFWVNQTTPTEKRLVLYIESEGQYIIYKLSDVDFLLLDAGKIICRINQVYYQLPWTIHNAVQFTQLSKCAALIKVKFTFRVSADLFLRLTQNTGTFRSRSNQKKI